MDLIKEPVALATVEEVNIFESKPLEGRGSNLDLNLDGYLAANNTISEETVGFSSNFTENNYSSSFSVNAESSFSEGGNKDVLTGMIREQNLVGQDDKYPLNQASSETKKIVFIDAGIKNYQSLISGINDAQIVVLDKNQDGIKQIGEYLKDRQDINSIHIVSHGTAGTLNLGNQKINNNNLNSYKQEIKNWSSALSKEADILLYGCNVAAGTTGKVFLEKISQLTGADIAASEDITGGKTGDWQLETKTGKIEEPTNTIPSDRNIPTLSTNSGSLALEYNQIDVTEEQGKVELKILRTEGSEGSVSVDYRTLDSTAQAGSDYQNASGTVTFAPGETSKTVSVDIIADGQKEGDESFNLVIDNPTGDATLGAPRTAQINIKEGQNSLPVPPSQKQDLIGYWQLDEKSIGETVIDASGNGNNGTHNNITEPNGPNANAPVVDFDNPESLSLDGVDDYVRINANSSLNLSGGKFSQSVWIYPTMKDNGYHGILGYQPSAGNAQRYPGIWVYEKTKIHAGFGDGQNWNNFTTGAVLTLNNWNHVVTTFDGTTYKAFVNGKQVYSTDEFAERKPFATEQLDLGRVDNNFIGQIDDVRIYKRALQESEIAAIAKKQPSFDKETIFSGLDQPTAIEWTANGNLAFIAQKNGVVRVAKDGKLQEKPFIDLSEQVNNTKDRGLLGLAVYPDFANNPYIYLLYTYDPPEVKNGEGLAGADGEGNRAGRLIRVKADPSTNYTTAIPGSEEVILGKNSTWENIKNPNVDGTVSDLDGAASGVDEKGDNIQDFLAADSTSHTIGTVRFAKDGSLFVTNGDGSSYNRVDSRTSLVQNLDNLSGKVLRIDPNTGKGLSDNPFFNGDPNSNRSKVYSYGLRNPFRFAINPNTNEPYIGEVGWTKWEEINTGKGANFGWPFFEGGNKENLKTGQYSDLPEAQIFYNEKGNSVTPSIYARAHEDGATAIVMGDFYTGQNYPNQYRNGLFFNDLGEGLVKYLTLDGAGKVRSVNNFATDSQYVVQLVTGPDGNLYYVDLDDGVVGRWKYSP